MGFWMLFLLLLAMAGWWLHSRWAALRDQQAARREAEMMFIFEARQKAKEKPAAVAPAAANDFRPTLPGPG